MGSANPIAAIAGPVLSLGGGLISGSKAADAAKGQAEALHFVRSDRDCDQIRLITQCTSPESQTGGALS